MLKSRGFDDEDSIKAGMLLVGHIAALYVAKSMGVPVALGEEDMPIQVSVASKSRR